MLIGGLHGVVHHNLEVMHAEGARLHTSAQKVVHVDPWKGGCEPRRSTMMLGHPLLKPTVYAAGNVFLCADIDASLELIGHDGVYATGHRIVQRARHWF